MATFEILCVTMGQKDFSKIGEMNIRSNVVFANQDNRMDYSEMQHPYGYAKMVTTNTKGVGKNRNIAMMYSSADICMFADDDVKYVDNAETLILDEFEKHSDADVFVFHLETNDISRKQKKYKHTRKCTALEKMPWGAFRICVRRNSVIKANIHFTELFGGGCLFPSGEDSMWLTQAKKAGLVFYVSDKTIGTVSFDKSTWFTGYDKKYYFAKGAYYAAVHSRSFYFWKLYFVLRTKSFGQLKANEKSRWMDNGREAYKRMESFDVASKSR